MDENKISSLYRIETCKFQREQNGDWEYGFLLDEGEVGIIDPDGIRIMKVWNWKRCPGFSIDFTEIENWFPLVTKSLDALQKLIIK